MTNQIEPAGVTAAPFVNRRSGFSTVLLDCDGVLLNWDRKFASWIEREHKLPVDPLGPYDWDLAHWIGADPEQALAYVQEFNRSPDFAYIEPCLYALTGIAQLVEMGTRLVVITSCSDDPAVAAMRRRNIRRCFGDVFDKIHCLGLGESKEAYLREEPPAVWIEDNFRHAKAGADLGHRTFMVSRSHNQAHKPEAVAAGIEWITSWTPVVSYTQGITI